MNHSQSLVHQNSKLAIQNKIPYWNWQFNKKVECKERDMLKGL